MGATAAWGRHALLVAVVATTTIELALCLPVGSSPVSSSTELSPSNSAHIEPVVIGRAAPLGTGHTGLANCWSTPRFVAPDAKAFARLTELMQSSNGIATTAVAPGCTSIQMNSASFAGGNQSTIAESLQQVDLPPAYSITLLEQWRSKQDYMNYQNWRLCSGPIPNASYPPYNACDPSCGPSQDPVPAFRNACCGSEPRLWNPHGSFFAELGLMGANGNLLSYASTLMANAFPNTEVGCWKPATSP